MVDAPGAPPERSAEPPNPLSYPATAVAADLGAPERGALRYARRVSRVRGRVNAALRALAARARERQAARAALSQERGATLAEQGDAGSATGALQALRAAQEALEAARSARALLEARVAEKNRGAREVLEQRRAALAETTDIRTRLDARLRSTDDARKALRINVETLRKGDGGQRASAAELGPELEALEAELEDLRTKRGEADAREAAARGAEAQARMALDVLEGGDRPARQRVEQAERAQEQAVERARAALGSALAKAGEEWLVAQAAAQGAPTDPGVAAWQRLSAEAAEDEAAEAAYREALGHIDRAVLRRGQLGWAAIWTTPVVLLLAVIAVFMAMRRGRPAHGAAAPAVPAWAQSTGGALEALADRLLPADAAAYVGVDLTRLGPLRPVLERFARLPADLERAVAALDAADSLMVFVAPSTLSGFTGRLRPDTLAGRPAFQGPNVTVVPADDGAYLGRGARLEASLASPAGGWRQSAAVDPVAAYIELSAPIWGFASQGLLRALNSELDALPLPRPVRRALRRVQSLGLAVFLGDGLFAVVAADLGSEELAASTVAQLEGLVTGELNRATVPGVPATLLAQHVALRVDAQVMVMELSLNPTELAAILPTLLP